MALVLRKSAKTIKSIHSIFRMSSCYPFHSLWFGNASKQVLGHGWSQFDNHMLRFEMGFHKSTHYMEKTKFAVQSADDEIFGSNCNQVAEDVEKICKALTSSSTDSYMACTLDRLGVRVSPELVEEVLKKLQNAGVVALGFFRWAEQKQGFKYTTEAFHRLIEALCKIKQIRLIWSFVELMKKRGLLRKDTFGLIIQRFARARQIGEAINAFEKMQTFGFKPDYNSLIGAISKSKQVRSAQAIFDSMKRRNKFSPDLKTYTVLLEGWCHERNLLKLMEVYQEMINEGFEPDVITYGILINSFCKSEMYDEALKTFHDMQASGCKPSPHVYCTLIDGLGYGKRLDEALKIFELSKTSGHPPEAPTYNALVGSYCEVLQFEDACRVMEEMNSYGIGPNARTYDILLRHLIQSGKKEEAYSVFQRMRGKGGCEPQLNTYTTMFDSLCSQRRVDLALKEWKEMADKGIIPCIHMFSSLINALCRENRLDEACQYFKEMLSKGIRPPYRLFGNLKKALLNAKRDQVALELGLEMDRQRRKPLHR